MIISNEIDVLFWAEYSEDDAVEVIGSYTKRSFEKAYFEDLLENEKYKEEPMKLVRIKFTEMGINYDISGMCAVSNIEGIGMLRIWITEEDIWVNVNREIVEWL